MSRPRAALLTFAATLAVPAAAHAADRIPGNARPHSHVVTYDRGDVRTQRLELRLRRSDHRLHGTIHLDVENRGDETLTRELVAGRCVGGTLAAPRCEAETTVRVRIPAGKTVSVDRHVTLHQPPGREDSVQLALVKPNAKQPFSYRSDALLLVRGRAWRGAGHTYGVRFAGTDAAKRLSFDIPAVTPTSAYADVIWTGTEAPTAATTTLFRCTAADCTGTPLRAAGPRSGRQQFGNRFDLRRDAADAIGLHATATDGTRLFTARLPWPA